jgi:hypothetical protein
MLQLHELQLNPIAAGFPQDRLYTFCGRGSVGMLPDTCLGVGPFWHPPVSGAEFGCSVKLHLPALGVTVGDQKGKEHYAPPGVMVQDIQWLPWCIARRGVYHRRVGERVVCLEVRSRLYAPADADGWIMAIELQCHGGEALDVELRPQITDPRHAFGLCHEAAWNYEPPAARGIVWPQGAKHWRTDGVDLHLVSDLDDATDAGWRLRVEPGRTVTAWVGASLHGQGLQPFTRTLQSHAQTCEAHWRQQWSHFVDLFGARLDALPIPRQLLVARSWTTLMVSRWTRSNFIADPFYSSEGIDGGAVCSYLWDFSYSSRLVSRLEGQSLRPLIERFAAVEDFWSGYALSPLSGRWLGVFYAFNPYAMVKVLADYVEQSQDTAILTRPCGSTTLLGKVEHWMREFHHRHQGDDGLLDFGHNRHLIELHTAGYEGRVPNPTFEHAWTLRAINQLRQQAGLARGVEYDTWSRTLLEAAQAAFWNDQVGWYFPAQQRDSAGVWSIQVLSALRLGVFPRTQVERMASHLNDHGFLGKFGLHSIAPHDQLHYTLNDVDWGGGGCFCGHTGIVIEGLRHYRLDAVADRLLDRIAWWGTNLPYLPQSARADAATCFQDRANAVAAGALAQALIMET